jgi:hypothetical protein
MAVLHAEGRLHSGMSRMVCKDPHHQPCHAACSPQVIRLLSLTLDLLCGQSWLSGCVIHLLVALDQENLNLLVLFPANH